MPGKPPGWIVQGVLRVLAEDGPMTRAAICRALGAEKALVSPVLSRLNKHLKTQPRRVYITTYTHEDDGSAVRYPRAVYALGSAPNRPKPPLQDRREIVRRSRTKTARKVSSVWEFAMPRRARAEYRKTVKEQTL